MGVEVPSAQECLDVLMMSRRQPWIIAFVLLGLVALAHAAAPPAAFAARFVETRTLPGFDQPLVSHGVMRFSKAQGFHWEITTPYHYVFEMKDGRATEQLPDGSKRTLDPDKTPWLAAVQHIFVSALSGDRARLAPYFKVKVRDLPGGSGRQMTLTPKSGALGQAITRIEVTESAPGQPRHLVIEETSGGRMDMRFTPIPPDDGG
jgi:hypothetical protein